MKDRRVKSGDKASAIPPEPASDRLQKVMAGTGMGSRRALEKQISLGNVLVNGTPAALGQSVQAGDRIRFRERDWLVLEESAQHRTLIYNKPEGELTTRSDPEGRPTVFDRLPWLKDARWVAVGRLDINTTGLLLLTTDGELANALMHPSKQVDREYVCRIRGLVGDEQLDQLRQGVQLDDGPGRFSDIQRMATGTSGNQWFQVTILEGRNREVRRLWEALGFMVSRLKRVRYGAAKLPNGLRMGQWEEIPPRDHRILRHDVKLPAAPARLTLQEMKSHGRPAKKPAGKKPARRMHEPAAAHPARRVAKPGSPAGAGRRPHPRSRKAQNR